MSPLAAIIYDILRRTSLEESRITYSELGSIGAAEVIVGMGCERLRQ